MVTNYERGRRFEWRVRDLLRKKGFAVFRCAGSKPVDLIALRRGRIVLVECKSDGRIDQRQLKKLESLAKKAGGELIIVSKDNYRYVIESLVSRRLTMSIGSS